MTVASVFTYGTLMPGQPRWGLLKDLADPAIPPIPDHVVGQLFDTRRGYPTATIGTPTTQVPGYTIRLDSPDVGLEILDAIEGVQHGLHERVLVMTEQMVLAWTYHWTNPTDHFTPINHWRNRELAQ